MVSSYLLRPLRSLEQAIADIDEARRLKGRTRNETVAAGAYRPTAEAEKEPDEGR
jgi:hypothetical protein